MILPDNREDLRCRWDAGERFQFYFFYGHKPPASGVDASCLSQWFQRVFTIDGIDYPTAEHWMMAEKARLFEDSEMLQEILSCNGPREAKAFGRKVRGFDNEKWDKQKFKIVIRGNHAKFSQHDDMKAFLLATANYKILEQKHAVAEQPSEYGDKQPSKDPDLVREKIGRYKVDSDSEKIKTQESSGLSSNVILVEAAGRDTIWGIGLGAKNPKAQDPFTWRGLNLLGFALTAVRSQLAVPPSV